MKTLFSSSDTLLVIIFAVVAIALWAQKLKICKSLGPALTVIIIGIFLSNLKIVPTSHDIYGVLTGYCIPLSIAIMMLSMDLQQIKKLTKEPLIALLSALISVCIMALIFGVIFGSNILEGWKVAGMFVGTYTGGSSNLTAIAIGLNTSSSTIASANAADYVIGIPTLIFMFAAPAILKSSKAFNKFWPYHHTEEQLLDVEGDDTELMASKEWSIKDIAWLLAIGFTIVSIATKVATTFLPENFQSAGRIILITTLAIITAQVPAVKKLKGNLDLGLYLSLLFLVTIGFAVDIRGFFGSTFYITLFCFCVIIGCLILHLLITRLFKIRYEYVVLSIVGCIADGPTSALVASSAQWKSLINIGLLMGVLAGACGNYLGISVAYAIKAILGM